MTPAYPSNVDYLQQIWPFIPLLLAVFLFWAAYSIRRDVQPIMVNVIGGVAKSAGTNAVACAIAIGFGLSASLEALSEQATALHWLLIAAFCKVANPFIVAVLAYATQNGFVKKDGTPMNAGAPSVTAAPFPPAAAPTPRENKFPLTGESHDSQNREDPKT